MPVGRLLIAVGNIEQPAFREVIARNLQADGQSASIESARNGDRRQAGD